MVMTITTDPALPDAQLTQAMVDRLARLRSASTAEAYRLARLRSASTAEALRELRTAFPEIPLAARVMALESMRRATSGSSQ
jgi:hypothetical protein